MDRCGLPADVHVHDVDDIPALHLGVQPVQRGDVLAILQDGHHVVEAVLGIDEVGVALVGVLGDLHQEVPDVTALKLDVELADACHLGQVSDRLE